MGRCRRNDCANASGNPCVATARTESSSYSCKLPVRAPQSACAFSRIASKTGARSPGEELMTCSTSAVAVCCSSASRVSVMQPRVLHRDDRLGGEGAAPARSARSVNGSTRWRHSVNDAQAGSPSRSSGTPSDDAHACEHRIVLRDHVFRARHATSWTWTIRRVEHDASNDAAASYGAQHDRCLCSASRMSNRRRLRAETVALADGEGARDRASHSRVAVSTTCRAPAARSKGDG